METKEKDSGQETLSVELSITTAKSEMFIDELEKLCKNFSLENDYFFKFQ